MTTNDTDEDLVRRTLSGEVGAYAVLVRSYRRAALARALAIVGDSFEADDVAQDAFVHAYDELATLRDPSRFGAWLLTIVRRRALNAARAERRRRRVPLTDALATDERIDEPRIDDSSARAALLAALAQLPEVQRTVVLLADLEEWSHQRIANTLGCSVVMSRRHLSDARRRLRALLAQGGSR